MRHFGRQKDDKIINRVAKTQAADGDQGILVE
jgi:hypothetical protein